MSHCSKGSEKPAFEKDCLRLYSMRFCPFAQRVRLVLAAKGVEYECVNINLKDKPGWFSDINPLGMVPAIEHSDGKVVYESAICCDYLNDLFPDSPLYPTDPYEKYKQRILVETLGNAIISTLYKILHGNEEAKKDLKKQLAEFEKYFKQNGTYIGGDNPRIGDYLVWPWFERLQIPSIQQELAECDLSQFAAISTWCEAMGKLPAVQECSHPEEMYVKFIEGYYRAGDPQAQLIGVDLKP